MQPGQHFAKHTDRVDRRPAVHAGMQILVGAGDRDLHGGHAAQHGADRWGVAVPHAGIANQGHIRRQLLLVGLQKRDQRRRTAFFFTLKKQRQLAGKAAGLGFKGPARLYKRHQLPLVIRRTAAANDLALGCIFDRRLKRRAVPKLNGINGLHIVMAVKQQVRARPVGMGDNHRMTGRVAALGAKADAVQIRHQPIRRIATGILVGRVGRDAVDAQEFE